MDENQEKTILPEEPEKEIVEAVSAEPEVEEKALPENPDAPEKETVSEDIEEPEKEAEEEPEEELPEEEPIEELGEEPKTSPKDEAEVPAPIEAPKETLVLTPDTVSSRDDVKQPDLKVSNHPNIIKNFVVIVVAVLLVGGIAGAVGYFLGKGGESSSTKKTKKKSESKSSYASPWSDALESFKEGGTTASTAVRPGYNVDILGLKKLCQNRDLVVSSGNTPSGFMALSDNMKLVVTLEELEVDFSELIDTMVYGSAPLDKSRVTQSDDRFIYEGFLDGEHPEYGYIYLKVVKLEGYYIMIQGLGDSKTDPAIVDARNLSDEILTYLGVK